MLPPSLAWKVGLHPTTSAHLANNSSSFPKWVPLGHMHSNKGTFLVIDCYNILSIGIKERLKCFCFLLGFQNDRYL
jgi:hypothetical protein